MDSLYVLSELLSEHHNKRVYKLIDEYDDPCNSAYKGRFHKQFITLIQGLLGRALKDNECLEKGILTGILSLAKAEFFSTLNNFLEDNLLTSMFS